MLLIDAYNNLPYPCPESAQGESILIKRQSKKAPPSAPAQEISNPIINIFFWLTQKNNLVELENLKSLLSLDETNMVINFFNDLLSVNHNLVIVVNKAANFHYVNSFELVHHINKLKELLPIKEKNILVSTLPLFDYSAMSTSVMKI